MFRFLPKYRISRFMTSIHSPSSLLFLKICMNLFNFEDYFLFYHIKVCRELQELMSKIGFLRLSCDRGYFCYCCPNF